ncbi:MAG: GNAT family N-acetyltransferase [Paludibacter sp.]|nr:GNAT family N-acetyltransferase [Paludibacter sp.]
MSNDLAYLSQLETLYLDTFSKGDAAQHFDLLSLRSYLNHTLVQGYALMCFDQNTLIACLLYAPLTIDAECPKQIRDQFIPAQCAYITEVMVAINYQGQGLGGKLMNSFFETIDNASFKDVFIRVWDKNAIAIKLYEGVGFKIVTSIEQTKLQVDGVTNFTMTKLYLHKPL